MQTHNPHVDQVRQIARASAFPTALTPQDLDAAFALASSARVLLAEAYKLLKADTVLAVQAETAGKAAKHLMEGVVWRMPRPGEGGGTA